MKFRIRDIMNFVETSSCTSIVQAAAKLEITQPALSESLKRLETDLGLILFYRSRAGIQLTPSGKIFLGKAQKTAQSIQELDISDHQERIFAGRTISIGCHPTVAQYSLPKALSIIKAKAPDYKIELKHELSRNIQAEIQKGYIDIGLVINPAQVPDLVIQKLAVDKMGLWSSTREEDVETVICNLALFQTQSILKRWGVKPSKVISTDNLELICRFVDNNIGVGILPERAVRLSGFSLRQLPGTPSYKDEICLLYRPEFGKIRAEKIVIEALKNSVVNN